MKKKSLVCVSIAMLWMIWTPGCSTTEEIVYDITGNWMFAFHSTNTTDTINFNFSGSSTNGIANDLTRGHTGIYTVNNTTVAITLTFDTGGFCGMRTETITGTFTAPGTLSGNISITYSNVCFVFDPWTTWDAYRL